MKLIIIMIGKFYKKLNFFPSYNLLLNMSKFPKDIKKINKKLILSDIKELNIVQNMNGSIVINFNPYDEMEKELKKINSLNNEISEVTNELLHLY